MKIFGFVCLFVVFLHNVKGQSDLAKDTVLVAALTAEAGKMKGYFLSGDMERFSAYTYPAFITAAGGKESFIKMQQEAMQQMKTNNIFYTDVAISAPLQIVQAGSELHSVLHQQITMVVNGDSVMSESYLLAVLNNNNWYFIDVTTAEMSDIKELFPYYNDILIIPGKNGPARKN